MVAETHDFIADQGDPSAAAIAGRACWSVLWILYEVLAGSPGWPELVAGGLASMAATVAALASGKRSISAGCDGDGGGC